MRHGMLVTAVATVTVPGLLAVVGVIGHDRQEAGAAVAVAALGTAALSGPYPVAPATARAGVRNEVAAVQRASGATVTVLSKQTAGQQAEGTRLLGRAADATQATSYQGTELITQSGVGGSVTETSQVWHRAGGTTMVRTLGGGTTAAGSDGSAAPEGVFGVTPSLVALLGKHYVAAYDGGGSVAGRPASVVELYRFDGTLAARYWLDKQTMLPLRRELLADESQVISDDSFTRVQFGPAAAGGQPAGVAAPLAPAIASAVPASGSTWVKAMPSALAGQGWQVPRALPDGLPLYAAASTSTTSGQVVDLEYSDGLYTVSVFVQRGDLAASLPGWRQVTVGGQQAFAAGHSVTWSGLGYVYTVIADAPPQTVTQVVGALPGRDSPGLWNRIGRGLGRLAGMANPFN